MNAHIGNGDLVTVATAAHVRQMVSALRASKQHRISPQVLASAPATARQVRPNKFITFWNISGKET